MNLVLPKGNFQQNSLNSSNLKHQGNNMNNMKSKLMRSSLMMCLFAFTLFFSQNAQAQTYSGIVTFGDSNEYSFDYSLVCGAPPTTATLTVNFTAPPPGIVPQIHLGGGMFVGMAGSGPYDYTFTGLTDCDFSFQFWMAYAGGLYASDFMTPINTPLPITLTDFSATKNGDRTATLTWKTSAEVNSDYFGIERSIDATNWETISRIKAAGFSNTDLSYSYLDTDLPLTSNAIFYYRLKSTDLDETYKYSGIRGVQFANNDKSSIVSIYPNPTIDRINVDLTSVDIRAGNVQLSMYNDLGKEILIKNVNGIGIELIDLTDFPSATYYIIVRQGTETIYQTNIIKVD